MKKSLVNVPSACLFRMWLWVFMCFTLLGSVTALAAESLRPFTSASLKELEHQWKGEAFLLVLWRNDCPPCREELKLLSEWLNTTPAAKRIPVIVVSTDSPANEGTSAAQFLTGKQKGEGLSSPAAIMQFWAFADNNTERLSYSIDPDWGGELPRSYFYRKDGTRIARSGQLTLEVLLNWTASQNI